MLVQIKIICYNTKMIWVIGSTGMLGTQICRALDKEKMRFVATSSDVDVRDYKVLKDFVSKWETENYLSAHKKDGARAKIDWIINCSAYTAVEKAEIEKEAAYALNVDGARNIARVARNCNAKLIHISTDYVFDGNSSTPYTEDMAKSPLGIYGKTKSLGEDEIQKAMTQYFIIRTSWLYGFKRPNFVTTMARLMNEKSEIKVVSDQIGSPTFTVDLSNAITKIIKICDDAKPFVFKKESIPYGIYHFTNLGETSWYDFALEIQRLLKKYGRTKNECEVLSCTTSEYGAKVERPAYSVLSKDKIISVLKMKIPKWQASLKSFIKDKEFQIPQ